MRVVVVRSKTKDQPYFLKFFRAKSPKKSPKKFETPPHSLAIIRLFESPSESQMGERFGPKHVTVEAHTQTVLLRRHKQHLFGV